MKYGVGYRTVRVLENVTEGDFNNRGGITLVEVTNNGDTAVYFTPNGGFDGGLATAGIPIASKTTRIIPMLMYNFKATGNVTVVAYGN